MYQLYYEHVQSNWQILVCELTLASTSLTKLVTPRLTNVIFGT